MPSVVERELATIEPELIVAPGATAARAVFDRFVVDLKLAKRYAS